MNATKCFGTLLETHYKNLLLFSVSELSKMFPVGAITILMSISGVNVSLSFR